MRNSQRPHSRQLTGRLAVATIALTLSLAAGAQQPATHDADDLAKQLSNPVADLVSVPFQFNWEEGVGPEDATRMVLNVQPVVPFHLNDDWNLIGRWIMPFVSQPSLGTGLDATYGLGDIQFSAFFSPRSSGLIWGVGPAVNLPVSEEPTQARGPRREERRELDVAKAIGRNQAS